MEMHYSEFAHMLFNIATCGLCFYILFILFSVHVNKVHNLFVSSSMEVHLCLRCLFETGLAGALRKLPVRGPTPSEFTLQLKMRC